MTCLVAGVTEGFANDIPAIGGGEVSDDRKPHRQICNLCHDVCRVDFWVPDDIWALALHESQSILSL